MAIEQTVVFAGPDTIIVDLAVNNTNETDAVIAHGLGATPQEVTFTPLLAAPAAANQWRWSAADATNVTLTRTGDESGESATKQLRVFIKRPHSIGR
jgi:hypothetical protein